MKTIIKKLLALSIVGCAFVGCTTKGDFEPADTNPAKAPTISTEHIVGINQILSYIDERRPQTKGAQNAYRLEAYNSAEGDTLMYIINYGNGDGWQILSTDTRTPAVIAESSTGRFSLEEGSPAVQVWMDMTATDIANIRNLPDEKLNFSEDEIASHKAFWASKEEVDRGLIDPDPNPRYGYWATEVSSHTVSYDTLNHLVPQWDQNAPYNAYCPWKSDGSMKRAPAGCVAIAGAQVLYYLHEHLGVPQTMVSDGYCFGTTTGWDHDFYDYTSTIWAQMSPYYTDVPGAADAEALMIGHVGKKISMNYTNNYSFAFPNYLRTRLFSDIGISSSHGNYDAGYTKSNLLDSLPVIVTASRYVIPYDGDIHCFVIDGYRRTRIETITYHYWVEGILDITIPEPYYTYSYSSPEIKYFKINWGWWDQWTDGVNDGFFSPTGDWYVDTGANYIYNRTMIYNLTISE